MADPEDYWWADQAKCKGLSPSVFFPVIKDQRTGLPVKLKSGADKPDLMGVQRAKRICNGDPAVIEDEPCPVRRECLHWAIINEQWDGVHGGMVERDKRKYARQKRAGIGFGGGIEAPQRPREVGGTATG